MRDRLIMAVPILLCLAAAAQDRSEPAAAATVQKISPVLGRLAGHDQGSNIDYVRLFLIEPASGEPMTGQAGQEFDLSRPTVTAQCTRNPAGKLHFELFVNFGGITDSAFYPPWRPTLPTDFPPRTEKVNVMMEFLGYTRVKPVKRQFERVVAPIGQLRYNTPGTGSSNMEDISYYLQFLKALPTLRVTLGAQTASFSTSSLLAQLHEEPLCRASGV